MAEYYAEFASGGFGLVITEAPTRTPSTARAISTSRASRPRARGRLAEVTPGARRRRPIVAQLMHAGAISQGNPYRTTVGPSAVQPLGE